MSNYKSLKKMALFMDSITEIEDVFHEPFLQHVEAEDWSASQRGDTVFLLLCSLFLLHRNGTVYFSLVFLREVKLFSSLAPSNGVIYSIIDRHYQQTC